MDKRFPLVAKVYLGIVMAVSWLLQIAILVLQGGFTSGAIELTDVQRIGLTICMFSPGIILLLFCAFKRIALRDIGIRPLRPLYWVIACGVVSALQGLTFISIIGFCDYPSFTAANGVWGITGVATILGYPNPPALFVINTIGTMVLSVVISIPQALGEELAWRGYLQKLFVERFGVVRGLVALGVVWGLFHVPINLAGYNFQGIPPWIGAFIFMPISCIALSAVFGWILIKSKSAWAAAAAHATFNSAELLIFLAIPRIDALTFNTIILVVQILAGAFFIWRISKLLDPGKAQPYLKNCPHDL
ncbi:MAG: CPBP family intramembrane metalloprotease [Coriobacteriales bacterium]|jgi:membrane protease YdiL (CAAX protease family)|nr:CPBP family intramembrane metalloprotease [Coriobacteriales bacterium]